MSSTNKNKEIARKPLKPKGLRRDGPILFVAPPRRCYGIDSSSRFDLRTLVLATNANLSMGQSTSGGGRARSRSGMIMVLDLGTRSGLQGWTVRCPVSTRLFSCGRLPFFSIGGHLKRINRKLDGGFVASRFEHYSTYDVFTGAMESHLVRWTLNIRVRSKDNRRGK